MEKFIWLLLLFIPYFTINYFWEIRQNKIKKQLQEIASKLPNFQNSQENSWFKEHLQSRKWKLALEIIEYFIKEQDTFDKETNNEILILKRKI